MSKKKKESCGEDDFNPSIVGFLCRWCAYVGADLAGTSRIKYPPTIATIRVPCSGKVDPVYVLRALLDGADGVLIAGCHPGDCHYRRGNFFAYQRYRLLKAMLRALNLEEDRVKLEWISASEGGKYAEIVKKFSEEIKELGENPLKKLGTISEEDRNE